VGNSTIEDVMADNIATQNIESQFRDEVYKDETSEFSNTPGMNSNEQGGSLSVDQSKIKIQGEGADLDIQYKSDPTFAQRINDFLNPTNDMGSEEIAVNAQTQFNNMIGSTSLIQNENDLNDQISGLQQVLEKYGYSMSDFLNSNIDQQYKTLDDIRRDLFMNFRDIRDRNSIKDENRDIRFVSSFHNFLNNSIKNNSIGIGGMEVNDNVVPVQ